MSDQSIPTSASEQPQIEYRDIQGFPDYRVGSDGSVWHRRKSAWRRIKAYRRPYGCRYVVVSIRPVPNGRVATKYVHDLVLKAFVGTPPEGEQACHDDGDTSNNSLANLQWGTRKKNAADRDRHGRTYRGSASSCAKLTESDIPVIRQLHSEGFSQCEIGRRFHVSQASIRAILIGRSWAHV